MLSSNCATQPERRPTIISASNARAAIRPIVEKSADAGKLSFASVPSTSCFTASSPEA
jgi:hypothetical protein